MCAILKSKWSNEKKKEKEHCFICIRTNACDYYGIRRAYRVNKPSTF